MTNLAQNLVRTVAAHPDSLALKQDDVELTWAEFEAAVQCIAGLLCAKGVGAGDRVALSLPNVVPFPVIAYGILRLCAVLVPMPPMFMDREVEYYFEDAGIRLVFGMAGETAKAAETKGVEFLEVTAETVAAMVAEGEPLADVAEKGGDNTAAILYTSGTTGWAKGAELTHANLQTNQEVTARTLVEVGVDYIIMGCLPLFHVFGLTCALNVAVEQGAALKLIPPVRFGEGARACAPASRAARPCLWRCCASARSASMPRSSRATASARPSRWHRSTTRKPSASAALSAPPIDGVEMIVAGPYDTALPMGEVG